MIDENVLLAANMNTIFFSVLYCLAYIADDGSWIYDVETSSF